MIFMEDTKIAITVLCPKCNTPLTVSIFQEEKTCPVCGFTFNPKLAEKVNASEVFSAFMSSSLLDKLDLIDLSILKRFYMAGKEPFDTKPYCLPILFTEMKMNGLNLRRRSFEYRLKKLVKLGLLKKVDKTNPSIYEPIQEIKYFVRKLIVLALTKYGFSYL